MYGAALMMNIRVITCHRAHYYLDPPVDYLVYGSLSPLNGNLRIIIILVQCFKFVAKQIQSVIFHRPAKLKENVEHEYLADEPG